MFRHQWLSKAVFVCICSHSSGSDMQALRPSQADRCPVELHTPSDGDRMAGC